MTKLETTLLLILILSLCANVGLIIYLRGAITRLLSFSEEMHDLQSMIDNFTTHITGLYQLEMFYGDETLQHLMEHATDLNKQLSNFEYIYTLVEKTDDTETEQTDAEEEEETSAE